MEIKILHIVRVSMKRMLRDDQIDPNILKTTEKRKRKERPKGSFLVLQRKDHSARLNIKEFFSLKFEEPS